MSECDHECSTIGGVDSLGAVESWGRGEKVIKHVPVIVFLFHDATESA